MESVFKASDFNSCSDYNEDYTPLLLLRSSRIRKRRPLKLPLRARLSDRRLWNPNPLKKIRNGSSSSSASPSPKLIDRTPCATAPSFSKSGWASEPNFDDEGDTGGGKIDSDVSDRDDWKLWGDDEDADWSDSSDWDISKSDSSDGEDSESSSSYQEGPKWPRRADYKNFNEYYKHYLDIVENSEGFTSFDDPTSTMTGDIRPHEVNKYVEDAANFAVQEQNKKGANVITLNKIVKVNRQIRTRSVYYITLEATVGDKTVLYETQVNSTVIPGKYKVEIFRLAKATT